MKLLVRILTLVVLIAGGVVLFRITRSNGRLSEEIRQLEAELGRIPINDPNRIHLIEIETPEVPPEVASRVQRVWQFRLYIPPGWDFARMSGSGRVAADGIYHNGSFSSGGCSPRSEVTQELLSISFQEQNGRLIAFSCFDGMSGTTSWNDFKPDQLNDSLVVQKLTARNQVPRSFDQDTILPVLKMYAPNTAQEKKIAGKSITTFAGGLFVLYPKSRQAEFDKLIKGETPSEFDPNWIASEVNDE